MILYIHGFASSGNSRKGNILKDYFGKDIVLTPDLPVEPVECVKYIENIISCIDEKILLIGSSLGGFYSVILSAQFNLKAVLINPALCAWEKLKTKVGVNKNYSTEKEFEWKKEFNKQLKEIYKNKVYNSKYEINPSNFFLLLAEDDELIDYKEALREFPDAGKILVLNNRGHEFSKFEDVLPEISGFYDEI